MNFLSQLGGNDRLQHVPLPETEGGGCSHAAGLLAAKAELAEARRKLDGAEGKVTPDKLKEHKASLQSAEDALDACLQAYPDAEQSNRRISIETQKKALEEAAGMPYDEYVRQRSIQSQTTPNSKLSSSATDTSIDLEEFAGSSIPVLLPPCSNCERERGGNAGSLSNNVISRLSLMLSLSQVDRVKSIYRQQSDDKASYILSYIFLRLYQAGCLFVRRADRPSACAPRHSASKR